MLRPLALAAALTTLVLLVTSAPAVAQQVIALDPGTRCHDVSADGSTVVGTNDSQAFIWRWREDPAPTPIGGLQAVAVNGDGTVIVGTMPDAILPDKAVAGRWTAATGWVSLGGLNSTGCPSTISAAHDVSDDGNTVTGQAYVGCNAYGFVWTAANGLEQLQTVEPGGSSGLGGNRGNAISGDGTVIGGHGTGNSGQTPAYWDAATLAGAGPDLDLEGRVLGMNQAGNWSLGTVYPGTGGWYKAFIRDTDAGSAFINLGSLQNDWAGASTDVSEDGSIITGYDYAGLAREGWIWTATEGIISLEDKLTALGVASPPDFMTCAAVSDDGNVVVGTYDPDGLDLVGGFIVELQTHEAWTDLGGGTAGANGIPSLSGTGSLDPNTVFTMDLVNAPPFAQMLVWVSLTSTPVAAFGGTIHAFPPNTEFLFPANGAGEFHAASLWPTGIPSGTNLYFQFLIGDATALPWGITISNGLKASTP